MSFSIDGHSAVSIRNNKTNTVSIFYPGWILFKYCKKYTVKDGVVCYVMRNKISFDFATKSVLEVLESKGFKMEEFDPPFSRDKIPQDEELTELWNNLISHK